MIVSSALLRFENLEQARQSLGLGVKGYSQPSKVRRLEGDFRTQKMPALLSPWEAAPSKVRAAECAYRDWCALRDIAAWNRVHEIHDGGVRTKGGWSVTLGRRIRSGKIPPIRRVICECWNLMIGEDGHVYVPIYSEL